MLEGKTCDPKYCLYHRIVSHNIKDCFVFKDKVQELLDTKALAKEEKKVTTNMVSMQFGEFPLIVPMQCEDQEDVEWSLIEDLEEHEDGLVPWELPNGTCICMCKASSRFEELLVCWLGGGVCS